MGGPAPPDLNKKSTPSPKRGMFFAPGLLNMQQNNFAGILSEHNIHYPWTSLRNPVPAVTYPKKGENIMAQLNNVLDILKLLDKSNCKKMR